MLADGHCHNFDMPRSVIELTWLNRVERLQYHDLPGSSPRPTSHHRKFAWNSYQRPGSACNTMQNQCNECMYYEQNTSNQWPNSDQFYTFECYFGRYNWSGKRKAQPKHLARRPPNYNSRNSLEFPQIKIALFETSNQRTAAGGRNHSEKTATNNQQPTSLWRVPGRFGPPTAYVG